MTADREQTGPDPAIGAQLLAMANGYQLSQALYAATALGIADLLAGGPMSVDALAAASGVDAPSLVRLMRALASRGIFTEDEDGRFALTPFAVPLRRDVRGSLHASILDIGESVYRVWGELLHSVRTGEAAFPRVFGVPSWQYRVEHPEANARYNERMAEGARQRGAALAASYDFSAIKTVVDVGGGDGTLVAALLAANSHLHGVLVDQPHVIEAARPVLDAAGVADRCTAVAGDFLSLVPSGGDLYLLSTVLHDWDDERAAAILRNCRAAMRPDGRVVVVEAVLAPGNEPQAAKFGDLHMLVMHIGGRERTEQQWRALFAEAGLSLTAITPLASGHSAIEGVTR